MRSVLFIATLALVPAVAGAQMDHAAHAATPVVVTFNDYAFDAPTTLPAGATTFRGVNAGKEFHHANLVRLEQGKRATDLLAAMRAPGPLPSWAVLMGGPLFDSEVTINLAPGTYAWWCFIPSPDGVPHFAKGMVREFTVTPTATPRPMPTADITVTMRDYGWDFSVPLKAGKQTLRVVNAPGQPHEIVIARLAPGKTAMDVAMFAEKPEGPPPFEAMFGSVGQQAGEVSLFALDLAPGRYAILCFLPDGKDGKPHFLHGMHTEVTVR